jgi:hypothetical protein
MYQHPKTELTSVLLGIALVVGGGCSKDSGVDSLYGEDTGGLGDGDGDGDGAGDGDGDGDGTGDGDGDGDGDGGPLLDVAAGDGDGDGDQTGEGCDFVDILFVIDNSGSMGDYQEALGLAFPQFATTMLGALPEDTNLHVGVTSTEMGYSSAGNTSINNGVCSFEGDIPGSDETDYYITAEMENSGRNGAQGRLYDPGDGTYYYEIDTDAGAAEIAGMEAWFSSAASIGEGGSNIEMLTAPVGWAADPINDATNAGFIRDEGAVMVVFFMQDEPDQTPVMLEGMDGGQAILNRLVQAKAGCGGLDCIVAGGFLDQEVCGGTRPINSFLGAMTNNTVTQLLPGQGWGQEGSPQEMADQMNELLSDTLVEVIAATCDQIPPVG